VRLSLWGDRAAVKQPEKQGLKAGDLLVVTKYVAAAAASIKSVRQGHLIDASFAITQRADRPVHGRQELQGTFGQSTKMKRLPSVNPTNEPPKTTNHAGVGLRPQAPRHPGAGQGAGRAGRLGAGGAGALRRARGERWREPRLSGLFGI